MVHSFVKSLVILAFVTFASMPALAQENVANAGTNAVPDAEKAELVAELAVRDSVMALHDSACTVEKKSLRSDLEMERAKCENWEQSYNSLKKDNEICAKALRVAVQASQEKKEEAKEKDKSDVVLQSASMAASFGLGMLIMWLILD